MRTPPKQEIKLGDLGRMFQFGTPEERARAQKEMELQELERQARVSQLQSTVTGGQRGPVATPEMARNYMTPQRADAGRPEVPFSPESRGIPSMPLTQAQLEANSRYAYGKRLETELGISRAQNQLAVQPLLAGVQRGILGKIGFRLGINPAAYPSPQYPQQSTTFGGQGFNWQNMGYAPPFPQMSTGSQGMFGA